MNNRTDLKRKASRFRDWNEGKPGGLYFYDKSWNEKHLDSEIETTKGCDPLLAYCLLETKSISIPRLKLEIDTAFRFKVYVELETKSISIPRLKLNSIDIPLRDDLKPWNEKHLDSEIETLKRPIGSQVHQKPWNEKHLDSEIETYCW